MVDSIRGDKHEVVAKLFNIKDVTFICIDDITIRYKSSYALVRYNKIIEYDDGYIVVDTEYLDRDHVEEYIDIRYVLDTLCQETDTILSKVKGVIIDYDECAEYCRQCGYDC